MPSDPSIPQRNSMYDAQDRLFTLSSALDNDTDNIRRVTRSMTRNNDATLVGRLRTPQRSRGGKPPLPDQNTLKEVQMKRQALSDYLSEESAKRSGIVSTISAMQQAKVDNVRLQELDTTDAEIRWNNAMKAFRTPDHHAQRSSEAPSRRGVTPSRFDMTPDRHTPARTPERKSITSSVAMSSPANPTPRQQQFLRVADRMEKAVGVLESPHTQKYASSPIELKKGMTHIRQQLRSAMTKGDMQAIQFKLQELQQGLSKEMEANGNGIAPPASPRTAAKIDHVQRKIAGLNAGLSTTTALKRQVEEVPKEHMVTAKDKVKDLLKMLGDEVPLSERGMASPFVSRGWEQTTAIPQAHAA